MQQKVFSRRWSQPDDGEDVSNPAARKKEAEGSVLEKYSRDLTEAAQDARSWTR